MTTDQRSEAERKYDMERSGELYATPADDDRPAHSPNVAAILAWIDSAPKEHRDMALLGMELMCYAHDDRPLPDHVKTAAWAGRYELARQRKIADDADDAAAPVADDEPDERPLGTIDGCPVTGYHSDSPPYDLYYASVTWNGLEFSTDGKSWINFATGEASGTDEGLGCTGDMHMWEWGKIKELAHTDVMEQPIALMQQAKAA